MSQNEPIQAYDPTKPNLLWIGTAHTLDEEGQVILRDLVQGYNVNYTVVDRGEGFHAATMAQRYQADVILVDARMKHSALAVLLSYMPVSTMVIQPVMLRGRWEKHYRRIVRFDLVEAPWMDSTDERLKGMGRGNDEGRHGALWATANLIFPHAFVPPPLHTPDKLPDDIRDQVLHGDFTDQDHPTQAQSDEA